LARLAQGDGVSFEGMTWSHIQKRIASALQEGIEATLFNVYKHRVATKLSKDKVERAKQEYLHIWPDLGPPPLVLANCNPILAGAGSVFNLAGTVDEPIVGLMRPGASPNEALELLPFYVDQAERILRETNIVISIAALATKRSEKRFDSFP
jgi:hypothetical protein